MSTHLEIGFELDRRWHYLRGEMDQSKKPALYALARTFAEDEVPYAVIGGIAFQVRSDDPRTTLDIDVAVLDRAQLPRERLLAEGFVETGSFPYTVDWQSRDGTPVQFSDDPFFRGAIQRAGEIRLEDQPLRIIQTIDLVRSKLASASEPQRRRSKRLRDLADIDELMEAEPALRAELTDRERALLSDLLG
jgi:hypothetical protein